MSDDEKQPKQPIPSVTEHLRAYVSRVEEEISRLEEMRDEAAEALEAISPQESSPQQAQGGKPPQR